MRGFSVHKTAPMLSSVQRMNSNSSEALIAYVAEIPISEKKYIIDMSLVPMPDIDIGIRLTRMIIGVNEST